MMKKVFLLLAAAALLGLTACGSAADPAPSESAASSEQPVSAEETVSPEETPAGSEEPLMEESQAPQESETAPVEFVPVAGLSNSYADLDSRSFAYDGKIYTLGETTLQDLIDGGLPLKEGDLNNAENNVNANYETSRYDAPINDYNSLQFTFLNTTDGRLTEKECLLSSVRWFTLYVPHEDYQESMNQQINENLADCAAHLCFSFPLTLTKDQLLENSPDPTEQDEYGSVKYIVDSQVYMGSSGYTFKFNKETDQLEQVSVSWLP